MTLGRDWCRLLLIQSGYAPASRAAGTVSASRVMMRLPTRSASQSRVAHDFCHPPHGEPGRVGDGLVRHRSLRIQARRGTELGRWRRARRRRAGVAAHRPRPETQLRREAGERRPRSQALVNVLGRARRRRQLRRRRLVHLPPAPGGHGARRRNHLPAGRPESWSSADGRPGIAISKRRVVQAANGVRVTVTTARKCGLNSPEPRAVQLGTFDPNETPGGKRVSKSVIDSGRRTSSPGRRLREDP